MAVRALFLEAGLSLCELEFYNRGMPEGQAATDDTSLNRTVRCREAVCEVWLSLGKIILCLPLFT